MHAQRDIPEPVLELQNELETYLKAENVALILRAYEVAEKAHRGQTRKTGEPYIFHPVAVARILANLHMDHESVVAALLHDTIEDTPLDWQDIEQQFGREVADLVEGVTKLDKMKFRTRVEADAESFRKLMLAMSRDLRVIFIKLADRLHNVRTLGSMSPDARRRIARETLEIYAPIADRLGMNSMQHELEDIGFRNLHSWRHKTITEHLEANAGNRKEVVETILATLRAKMAQTGIPCRVSGRQIAPYSIYKRMQRKEQSFTELTNFYAFRIVSDTESHCYLALGAVHSLYQPKPGGFKDYIALPKANGYQSLHTMLNSPYDLPIQIQIRTEEMDLMARKGAAAHWQSRDVVPGGADLKGSAEVRAREWLMRLMDVQRHTGDSLEFLDHAKSDLFPDEIFVFTPKGKIIDLRQNSTVLDFAYSIHTDVGNHTARALVDGVEVPLATRLENGQTVTIETETEVQPRPEWLEFTATARARSAIRHYLKSLGQEDTVALGMRLLEKALNVRDCSIEHIPEKRWRRYLKKNNYRDQDGLYRDLALGRTLAHIVAAKLAPDANFLPGDRRRSEALTIAGTEGSALSFGACCRPVPGDNIMAYVSADHGLVVHRVSCANVREFRKHPDRCIAVNWAPITQGMFPVALRIDARNTPGVLASISTSIGQAGSNIETVAQPESNPEVSTLLFTISVRDRDQMAIVLRRLRRNPNVLRVHRVT
ncbi:MAG: bifunctional (p)ppGpp synthetase/guanosine-3',5'-bis(diphosphate) 3'-pyrophosphohydrolase [Xanthomonadales bacterium]|nr:bifunctional (p)ppGpp synthetase/guanosine-3',5'-bis(diphosphate) 3'-pyrophosphohydrolase [Gammaproteobacteria bacterium]MBT8051691.1 bifunctional (p)ppGpp synthetase/guanosine-3',5'-bis(diphosphate) 3'-pyrophosphohydrolase [Gammaproteobacteria bacterium]MBT8057126.1 bifunctional (p)ppGpp synthetase/guanosine-3',5'-bis(diphosphate) 3'-pyrophosphohydrolase [Gammaproteobacteria bacterium]NNJ80230.1 bifunctional (p)ppGpp synthetase/guanosine-3',5'-bis(diphosphate) 3'-pyrophosphohydrolase [Xantho